MTTRRQIRQICVCPATAGEEEARIGCSLAFMQPNALAALDALSTNFLEDLVAA